MIGILVCGPSGVGKSSNLSKIFADVGIHELELFDPDNRSEKSQDERSEKTREEVLDAIQAKKEFVYSGSCLRGKAIQHILQQMHDQGYTVVMAIVYTSLDTALKRILSREQKVSESIVKTFHRLFKTKAETYMNNPLIDKVFLYNNETKFTLILDKQQKEIHCHADKKFYFDISPYCSGS